MYIDRSSQERHSADGVIHMCTTKIMNNDLVYDAIFLTTLRALFQSNNQGFMFRNSCTTSQGTLSKELQSCGCCLDERSADQCYHLHVDLQVIEWPSSCPTNSCILFVVVDCPKSVLDRAKVTYLKHKPRPGIPRRRRYTRAPNDVS